MARHGVDPVDELIKMALEQLPNGAGFRLTADQRIGIWQKLVEYRHPKLSALKSVGAVDRSLTVIIRKTLTKPRIKQLSDGAERVARISEAGGGGGG
jgi:hypothetical protein